MDRTAQIILLLADRSEPMTLAQIADIIGVSVRTVRYDLDTVQILAEKVGMSLVKKTGVGIQLEGSQQRRRLLRAMCKNLENTVEPFSPEDRKYIILKKMLTNRKLTTIDELSKRLFISRTAVHKDLERVEEWLVQYKLQLNKKPNLGIDIVGNEEDIRNALAVLSVAKRQFDFENGIGPTDFKRMDVFSVYKLQSLLPLDYMLLEDIIIESEKRLGFVFSDEVFLNLATHIAIAMKRIEEGKAIEFSQEIFDELLQTQEYVVACWIGMRLLECFGIEIPENEVIYILAHILDGKKQQNAGVEPVGHNQEEEDNRTAVIMADEIAAIASQSLAMPLCNDQAFLNGLILHLRPTIRRLKCGLKLKNPIMDEIKSNYADIFSVAWMTGTVFERYINQKIDEDEVGYLALHIGAAVERNKSTEN